MPNIVHLFSRPTKSSDTRPVPPLQQFSTLMAALAEQSERLQAAIDEIGNHLHTFTATVQRVIDPISRAEFNEKIETLRCQLLLATLELAQLNCLRAQFQQSPDRSKN